MQKHKSRLLFLKEFTKELILNSKTREEIKEPLLLIPTIHVPVEPAKEIEVREEILPAKLLRIPKPPSIQRYPIRKITPIITPFIPTAKITREGLEPPLISQSQITPEITTPPVSFNLGKINFLISDPRVTVIECPGPNKLILARTLGETLTTRVSLSPEEISSIIGKFSQEAKIPVISGLFKAAVGNLIITAVTSEIVGSRFIITKMTPRLMLEQASY